MAGTPIVPATPSPIRSSTTGPADGELANAASVNGAFQDLMEGVLGLRLASYGRRAQIHVRSSNRTTLIVGALGSVILTTGGGSTWLSFLNTTQQTVTAATAFGGALGNLTRYFLYAYNNAGALDFIVTTTAPDASRTYENGNTDRVFISTFITDGSGIIVPFTHVGNQYHYGPALDYAIYLKGIINFNDDLGLLSSITRQDLSERDQKAAKESFESFKELVARFPDSRYAPDARQRMAYIVGSLAQYEVHVARYYYKRGAYLAAINRAQNAVADYRDVPALEEAIFIIYKSYDALGMTQLRDDTKRVLEKTYPRSDFLVHGSRALNPPWWKFW